MKTLELRVQRRTIEYGTVSIPAELLPANAFDSTGAFNRQYLNRIFDLMREEKIGLHWYTEETGEPTIHGALFDGEAVY